MDRKTQRQWVAKLVFEMDIKQSNLLDIDRILSNHELEEYSFIRDSLLSIYSNVDKIDQIIKDNLTTVKYSQVNRMDRSIMRTSINEFVVQKSVPTNVSINEAVELAKMFSKEDSYRFVNGVLSSVAKDYK